MHLQRTLGVPAKSFVASYHGSVLDKVYHVQTANNYHEQLKSWIQRALRGVATKNLPNYLAWRRLLSWDKDGGEPLSHLDIRPGSASYQPLIRTAPTQFSQRAGCI